MNKPGGRLDDIELVRKCAEAMGIEVGDVPNVLGKLTYASGIEAGPYRGITQYLAYDPLHDDAQAMALVRRFGLSIQPPRLDPAGWHVWAANRIAKVHKNLNRAICLSVAQLSAAGCTERER